MAYKRVNWEDSPSTSTPLSAENLNKMDKGIEDVDKNKLDNTNGSVKEANIANGAITEDKIRIGSVTVNKIADGVVTNAKLADGAIANINKISSSLIDSAPKQNSTNLITSGAVYKAKNELQLQINNMELQTNMFDIGMSVAYDENMNVLKTSTNTILSGGSLSASGTVYVYIPSSVTTIEGGAINFTNLKLIVIDNTQSNATISFSIPETVKVIYTQNLDTVPVALMKMAYANSEIFKNYYNKTDSKSRFAQGVSAIYDAKGNIVKVCSKTSLSGGDLFGDSSVKTAFVSNNVTSIGSGTFSGCTNLETVYIDNTQSNLEHGGLTIESGAIPFGAEIVYTDEFNGVTHNTEAIASINESVNNLKACAILNETVAFDENGVVLKTSDDTVISGGIFTGNTAIKKVFIPSSVTEIQSGGFYGCSNLTEITIDNVEGQVTISSNAIPENVDIVYTNKFNVVTTLCKAVAMLNNKIQTLEAKIKELEK